VEEADLRVQAFMPKQVPLPSSSFSQSSQSQPSSSVTSSMGSLRQGGFEPKKRRAMGNTAIEKAFNLHAQEELQYEIGRMFYSAGLPFHFARNPLDIKAFTLACNSNLAGFVPPGYNMLRTILL